MGVVNKGKKGKKNNQQSLGSKSHISDFKLIQQFNTLQISAPLNEEDFPTAIDELNKLKLALIYWGKIILRQNKIKFIRTAPRIQSDDKYQE